MEGSFQRAILATAKKVIALFFKISYTRHREARSNEAISGDRHAIARGDDKLYFINGYLSDRLTRIT